MNPTTVSLVLGSGGARGLAHIGVIEWLTAHGYQIRSISGSSIGAVIGGVYAAGALDAYTRWISALKPNDVIRLLDLSFARSGLLKGDRIIAVLKKLVGDRRIEDLPVSFTAVATDVCLQKEIWLRTGPLFEAIRASMAMPLVFTPFTYHGRQLVDGGVINPIPIAPTLNDFTDITVAVSLSAEAEPVFDRAPIELPSPDTPRNDGGRIRAFMDKLYTRPATPEASTAGMMDVFWSSMEAMQNTIARLKLAAYAPDVVVEIPRNVCALYEFHRARELIAIGRERTARAFARRIPR